ncbi:MAG: molecular chaperone HtpG [Sorangiineae bacterium]|nr:molecular chaperone HtpG [Polyangiaceae bacterium]MEB2321567.1 molecular chaperone HtpG [Sorangiineae bacterium]
MTDATEHRFQAEVSQVLRLVIGSLYSHKEIFLRELVSNASDALDKLRFRALSEPALVGEGDELRIRIRPDAEAGTLSIEDNGVGMTAEELVKNLGTIAWSGSREFLEKLEAAQSDATRAPELIGQFGVGFYSAYLVAERVSVTSRAAGSAEAHRWESDAREGFTVSPAERAEHGTTVVLQLKEGERYLTEPAKLRELIRRYSDFIQHPIELADHGEFSRANQAAALWQRSPKEVTREQYEELYRHLGHDFEPPLAWKHFRIEGTQMFSGIVYIPRKRPLDLFDAEPKHGVRLHVRRVLVMESAEELVPRWLRFVRGVVDSEDLPLNVSREVLQDSRPVEVIRKQLTAQTLELIDELARERPEDFRSFTEQFGSVLKEGLHFEPELRERLARLVRFSSTASDAPVSLEEYAARMPEGQSSIYYAIGQSRATLAAAPQLEALRARGYEVLLMTDAVDPFALAELDEHDGKPLASAIDAGLELGEGPGTPSAAAREAAAPLLTALTEALGDAVGAVRASSRLVASPACLVSPPGALAPHVERALRARGVPVPETKRILEVNLEHPLTKNLAALAAARSPRFGDWAALLRELALLAEGSAIEEPERFAGKLTEILTEAAQSASAP